MRRGKYARALAMAPRWIITLVVFVELADVPCAQSAEIIVINDPVIIESGDSSLQNPSDHLLISTSGVSGDLVVRNQGLVEAAISHVGNGLGAIGALTVENSGSVYRTTDHMIIGFLGSGTMTVQDGGLVDIDPADAGVTVEAGRAFLGYEAGAQGVVNVVGTGSLWQMTSHLYVGWEGAGTMNITEGGKVASFRGRIARFDNSIGEVNVIGSGSLWQLDPVDGNLAIGHAASTQGKLNLLNGGTVIAGPTLIGRHIGGRGVVNVDGTNSLLWLGPWSLSIGELGEGTLNIRNQGRVISKEGFVGTYDGGGGLVTIDGIGSIWQMPGSLKVGRQSVGTLNITGGGRVENQAGLVGAEYGSHPYPGTGVATAGIGTVNVDGAASVWQNSAELIVAGALETQGTLNITSGGRVTSSWGFVGRGDQSSGTVVVDGPGSVWAATANLYIGGDYTGSMGSGQVTLRDGGALEVGGSVTVWDTGTLSLSDGTLTAPGGLRVLGGTLDGTGTIVGNVNVVGGTISSGQSPGSLTISGDYISDASTALSVELEGTGTDAFDSVMVSLVAQLGGTLNVSLIDGFLPEAGDTFTILAAGSILGAFDAVHVPPLSDGLRMDIRYGAASVTLEAIVTGDMNCDAQVDFDDIESLLLGLNDPIGYEGRFGMAPSRKGDLDLDGDFDFDDVGLFVGLLASGSLRGSAQMVPEPSSLGLLAVGLAGLVCVQSSRIRQNSGRAAQNQNSGEFC